MARRLGRGAKELDLLATRSAKQHRDSDDPKGLLEAVRQMSGLELQLTFLRRFDTGSDKQASAQSMSVSRHDMSKIKKAYRRSLKGQRVGFLEKWWLPR